MFYKHHSSSSLIRFVSLKPEVKNICLNEKSSREVTPW